MTSIQTARRARPVRALTRRLAAGIGALLVAAGSQTAAAQSTARQQVIDQLQESQLLREWLGNGFLRSHDPVFAVTVAGGAHDWWIDLHPGSTYRMIGKCDNDCRDLDFALYDELGRQVASDFRADDYPVVQLTPPAAGRYRLRVIMAACATYDCVSGVLVVRRPSHPAWVSPQQDSRRIYW